MDRSKTEGAFTWVPIAISIVFWAYVISSIAGIFILSAPFLALTFIFDRRRRMMHMFNCLWAHHYIWVMPLWRISIEGRENMDPGKLYVMVSNHQSLLDVPVLFGLFKPFKWVSKEEVLRVPFIGWIMAMARYVGLKRGSKGSMLRMMRDCRREIKDGNSLLMFPEGTRSPDGEVKEFLQGAFALAQSVRVDVLPIVLDGTFDSLPKQGLVIRRREPVRITVRILPPIAHDAAAEPEDLSRMVYERISSELRVIRKSKRA